MYPASLFIILTGLATGTEEARNPVPMSNHILQPIIDGARDYSNDRAREKRRDRRENRDDRRERERRRDRDRHDDRRHHRH